MIAPERAGLVTRETDPTDLRRSLIRLTPEGFSLLDRMVAEHLVELEKRGPEIIQALHNVLGHITANGTPAA